jgi:flagellar basal body-associated protein FliL
MGAEMCTSWKEAPAMTGSFLVLIITPIVAVIFLAGWLGMVFWAASHPEWKTHAAQETQYPGESLTLAGDLEAGELAPPQQERKAA